MDFWHALAGWADRWPDKPAVISPRGELTYAQLAGRAQHLAGTLHQLAQQRVGILTSDPTTMAVAFHGAALAGKTLIVLDPAWPAALLHSMIRTLNCSHVMANDVLELAPRIPATTLRIPDTSDAGPWVAHQHPDGRELLIICTSGTTSRPKAIIRSAASWQDSVAAGACVLEATEEAITLSPGPISHGLGLYSLVESIHTGGTFAGTGRWSAQDTRSLLGRVRCNRIVSVPTILDRLLAQVEAELLSTIRWVVSGGESLSAPLVARLYGLPALDSCVEYFGSSEHSLIAYSYREPDEQNGGSFSGRLFPGVSIHLHDLDPDTGIGTVYVDSPFNAAGYDPQTAPPIARCNNSTSILDMAIQSTDQRITFIRRDDGMLNLHGNNIHPSELLDVLSKLNVHQAKIRLESIEGELRLVAYVRSPVLEREILQNAFAKQLPIFKMPHEVIFLEDWPQAFSGKTSVAHLAYDAPEIVKRIRLR